MRILVKSFYCSYTIVENFATFWTNQQSQFVLISPGDIGDLPETTTEEETTEETTDESTDISDDTTV